MDKNSMQPVNVTARFLLDGKIDPQQFVWKGRIYQVDSTGRQWQEPDGLHILVMIPSQQVIELVFKPGEMKWFLAKFPPGFLTA